MWFDLDNNGACLAHITVPNNSEGLAHLHEFAAQFVLRRWAIEGAANRFIAIFVSQLVAQGGSAQEKEIYVRLGLPKPGVNRTLF